MLNKLPIIAIVLLLFVSFSAVNAGTHIAVNCTQSAVQTAIDAAANGDTVIVPSGSCTWTGSVTLGGKGLHITAATKQGTTIIHDAGSTTLFPITENSERSVRISNFRFDQGTGGLESWDGMYISVYPTTNGKPVLIDNNYFNIKTWSARVMRINVNRGVIWQNTFNANKSNASGIVVSIGYSDDVSWTTAASMGMKDSTGTKNIYIEDNTFLYFSSQAIDPSEGARVVIRNNLMDHAPMASHGADTDHYGVRHWEVYNNDFRFTNHGDCSGTETFSVPWYFYIRGGTGIVTGNVLQDLSSCAWGTPTEFVMQQQSLRRNSGINACYSGTYPMPYQIAMGHNGTALEIDPIYVWNNTGTGANSSMIGVSDYSPSECGTDVKCRLAVYPGVI